MTAIPLSPAGVWALDTAHTQVGFSVRHLGISTVRGFFTDFSGQATIGEDLASSSVTISANTRSIDTGNAWRDEHLQAADFLDCENHPTMSFVSTALVAASDAYTLEGDLTIRGVTLRTTFNLLFHGTDVFPMDNKTHAGFLATATVRRSDFGAGHGVPIASDEVQLSIDAQIIAPDPA